MTLNITAEASASKWAARSACSVWRVPWSASLIHAHSKSIGREEVEEERIQHIWCCSLHYKPECELQQAHLHLLRRPGPRELEARIPGLAVMVESTKTSFKDQGGHVRHKPTWHAGDAQKTCNSSEIEFAAVSRMLKLKPLIEPFWACQHTRGSKSWVTEPPRFISARWVLNDSYAATHAGASIHAVLWTAKWHQTKEQSMWQSPHQGRALLMPAAHFPLSLMPRLRGRWPSCRCSS